MFATTTAMPRSLVLMVVGVMITLSMLWVMQRMVAGGAGQSVRKEAGAIMQFIRLKRAVDTQLKQRRPLPKPPPSEEPLPPSMPKMVTRNTTISAPSATISLSIPTTSMVFSSPFLGPVMSPTIKPVMSGPKDRDFVPLSRMPPQYPFKAKRRGFEGWVKLSFVISTEGKVQDIVLIDSKPRGMFDKAAFRAISRWTFKPRIQNGKAVITRTQQTIDFKLER